MAMTAAARYEDLLRHLEAERDRLTGEPREPRVFHGVPFYWAPTLGRWVTVPGEVS